MADTEREEQGGEEAAREEADQAAADPQITKNEHKENQIPLEMLMEFSRNPVGEEHS